MRLALPLVGVEQGIRRVLAQDAVELPREIRRIANPSAHALTQKGRRLVAGVPGEEHPALAPDLGEQRVESVDRRAPELDAREIDEAADLPCDVLGLAESLRVFAGKKLDLPAAQASWSRNERRGPGRPAVLDASRGQLDRRLEQHIDHHPPLVEAKVLQ